MPRREFLASTSLASAVGLLAPHALFAGAEVVSAPGLEKARKEATSATITIQRLRGNISVLMGAGGDTDDELAVPAGKDSDAGYAGARPQIANALSGISSVRSFGKNRRTK